MEALETWFAEQLKSPLAQALWLIVVILLRFLYRFSSKTRKRKRPTPRRSPKTT